MAKTVFYTLGCRANQYQTELLKSKLIDGNSSTDFGSDTDLYIINTCVVTADAERTSRQAIRKALKSAGQVIVTGCYARLAAAELKQLFPQINIAAPIPLSESLTDNKEMLPQLRANLMVQDGCENFCSYCIVPFARGKFKSKPIDTAVREAERMIGSGVKELVLTGINLGAYQFDLTDLIDKLSRLEGLLRLRLSSIEPIYLKNNIIECIARNPKLCHHLHIPLQSGDDNILKSMNRNYTGQIFSNLVQSVREKIPDCALTTDVIVAFPGEGEKEFQQTVELIDRLAFGRIHIFSYSKREGTLAATLPHQVKAEIKKVRNRALHLLREKHMATFAREYLGKEVEILVERKGEGLTSNYIRVLYPGNESEVGKLKKLTIKEIKKDHCLACC